MRICNAAEHAALDIKSGIGECTGRLPDLNGEADGAEGVGDDGAASWTAMRDGDGEMDGPVVGRGVNSTTQSRVKYTSGQTGRLSC